MSAVLQPEGLNNSDNVQYNRVSCIQKLNIVASSYISLELFITIIFGLQEIFGEYKDNSCDKPLKTWVSVNMLHLFWFMVFTPKRRDSPTISVKIWKFVTILFCIFTPIWYIFGTYWIVSSKTCKSEMKNVYYIIFWHTISNWICLAFGILNGVYISQRIEKYLRENSEDYIDLSGLRVYKYTTNPVQHSVQQNDLENGLIEDVEISQEDAHCTICLEDYNEDDLLRVLDCHHHFHRNCSDDWFVRRPTCPVCVRRVSSQLSQV